MISESRIQQLLIKYNLHTTNVKIKYKADYSIIGILWFASIKLNNIKCYGQSRNKEDAVAIAIQKLAFNLTKK